MASREYERDMNVRLVQPRLKVQPDCALKSNIQNKERLRIGPIDREKLLRREMDLVKKAVESNQVVEWEPHRIVIIDNVIFGSILFTWRLILTLYVAPVMPKNLILKAFRC